MAKKITELTELTTYATNDLLIIEDVSTSTTKKITWANLVADGSITTAKIAAGAVTTAKTTFSGARVYKTAGQNLADAVAANILFDTESYDTDAYHDTGSNTDRLTAATTGYYRIGATVIIAAWDSSTNRRLILAFIKNGSSTHQMIDFKFMSDENPTFNFSIDLLLSAGDYITLNAYQNTLASRAIETGVASTAFWIQRLGS